MTRAFVDELWAKVDEDSLSRNARLVPLESDGGIRGLVLVGFHPDGPIRKLGLENGDLIPRIDGVALSTPPGVLELYARLRTAKKAAIELERRGAPVTIRIHVVER